jgi:hypothetical protein
VKSSLLICNPTVRSLRTNSFAMNWAGAHPISRYGSLKPYTITSSTYPLEFKIGTMPPWAKTAAVDQADGGGDPLDRNASDVPNRKDRLLTSYRPAPPTHSPASATNFVYNELHLACTVFGWL